MNGPKEHQMGCFPTKCVYEEPFNNSVSPVKCLPLTCSVMAPLSIGFSKQEYWSGLPFPSPGDSPNPGIEPRSPALHADSLPSEPSGKPQCNGNQAHCKEDCVGHCLKTQPTGARQEVCRSG